MRRHLPAEERLRVVSFWRTIELFSPQPVPARTRRATRPPDRQVIEWQRDDPLPWNALLPPRPLYGQPRVWRHRVYLGVYKIEATYESLQRVFGQDPDAYDERPRGESACAGVLIDHDGRVVTDSAVLSSALWGIGRSYNPGPRDSEWMEGFEAALAAFAEEVDRYEGTRREALNAQAAPAHDADSLHGLLDVAHMSAGIGSVKDLATDRVVIESVAVPVDRDDDSPDGDFLNSFYLDELAMVRELVASGDIGAALGAYLAGDETLQLDSRIDVLCNPDVVDAGTAIERLPPGRWPANPTHCLALSQQFAVNEAITALGPASGLIGVNGPPGTGKTTMLRDILAANVVERARRLAVLEHTDEAFTDATHRWIAHNGYPRVVCQLSPELTGFEMVIASANNAAVENVTGEIPASTAIHESWRGRADYFAAMATEVMRAAGKRDPARASVSAEAWGLVAARLGSRKNRSEFYSAFWFDEKDPTPNARAEDRTPRMQTQLKRWRDGSEPYKPWAQAREDFAEAWRTVDVLIEQRRRARDRRRRLAELDERERALDASWGEIRGRIQQIDERLADHARNEYELEVERTRASAERDRQLALRPGVSETLRSLGRATRDWRTELRPLSRRLRETDGRLRDAKAAGQQIRDTLEQAQADQSAVADNLAVIRRDLTELRDECQRDELRYGDGYPGDAWTSERRELHAPWLDAELDTARSELFLAALQLHQDFLANAADKMLPCLRAAVEVVAGRYPRDLEAEKLRAAWQLFFLVVPVVSTTFASMGRMFGGVGCEAIGWLMVDEAGQSSPQCAAGGILRAQRVIVVGDPQQLVPVVTVPQKAERDIASHYGVSETWVPSRASVQSLADRVARFGATLGQGENEVWVSAPLRVHRRCDEPMFSLCNSIAYDGIMVSGVHRNLSDPASPDRFDSESGPPPIAKSYWADECAVVSGSHLQQSEIERVHKALAYLTQHGIHESEIIVISPFRMVADRLKELTTRYPGLRAGTIHTAQGREAPVVILVLGGDPSRPGAKGWAASTPNLVNVAASRAQRRLYVIGDRGAWEQHNHFRELSAVLK